jgi:hypothetical protein
MAEAKTKANSASVDTFLNSIPDDQVRKDCRAIAQIMQKAANAPPQMWGTSIVGFGTYRFKYADGRKADWMITAFSPRRQNITLYIYGGFEEYEKLTSQLGKYSCGKSCIYIKRLSDVDMAALKKLIKASVQHVLKKNLPGA